MQPREAEIRDQLKAAMAVQSKDFLDYDPMGLPDEKDIKNIKTIIRNHEKARPGEMAGYVAQAKKERDTVDLDASFGAMKSGSARRTLTMPIGLLRMIEEAYPLMFSNKDHIAWFKANFPQFTTRSAGL